MNKLLDLYGLDKHIVYFLPKKLIKDQNIEFRDPFDNIPDEYALQAVTLLKERLKTDKSLIHPFFEVNEGKMFGVLVVANASGLIGYLSAFSGMLHNQWAVSGFVPPIFDIDNMASLLREGEGQLNALSLRISALEKNDKRVEYLKAVNHIKQQSVDQLDVLKSVHRANKKHRKERRECLCDDSHKAIELKHLSQESQDDKRELKAFKIMCQQNIDKAEQVLEQSFEHEIDDLKKTRKLLSQRLHAQAFELYQIRNYKGIEKPISTLFNNDLPPGGAGDCAAPKLLQYALNHKLTILSLSEFWWGASPKKEIRHHQQMYPPCRSKCHHILPFMFDGLLSQPVASEKQSLSPKIIYEDNYLMVLNKPAGLLSIPGKQEKNSVLTWLKKNYADAEGALLVHRLDQATSGVMLAAKNAMVYKALQKQFIHRSIKKRYIALLSKPVKELKMNVNLPLRVDLDDRPRQLVCFEHGKSAETNVELIANEGEHSRVYLYPKTGRTHQLRVHAAHVMGLDNPIVGDLLYGVRDKRLMLHAETIEFEHPVLKQVMTFKIDSPF